MAKTLVSSSTLFLPAADFLVRADKRSVCQLCSDTGVPITDAAIATNTNLLAALGDACGIIEAACYNGGRYTNDDLELLVATNCHARNLLYRLIVGMTMMFLFERRPDPQREDTPAVKRAKLWLDELYQGKQIFAFQETVDAGHLDHEVETAQDVQDRGMITQTANRLFGSRNNTLTDR